MAERVVLLAIDGLDWTCLREGVRRGRLPNFARLLAEGAYAEIDAHAAVPGLEGVVERLNSPTLWTSVATGRYYFQHGVFDFRNLIENPHEPPLFESRHVRSPRVWDVLSHYGIESVVVGYYVTHPAYPIRGVMVSDLFGEVEQGAVVQPPEKRDELAAALGAADYAGYVAALRRAGEGAAGIVPSSRDILSEFTSLSSAEIDELLAGPPESNLRRMLAFRLLHPVRRDGRMHRAFMELLRGGAWRFATAYYTLVDYVSHGFWTSGLSLPEGFTRAYGDTLSRAYEWIDRRLGEILAELGESDRVIVMSDHGFGASGRRVELESCRDISEFSYGQHASPAVLLARGGVRGVLSDLSLMDVAPSILDFFELPLSEGLDGGPADGLLRPQVRRAAPRVADYPYEPPCGNGQLTAHDEERVLSRLAALGYLE